MAITIGDQLVAWRSGRQAGPSILSGHPHIASITARGTGSSEPSSADWSCKCPTGSVRCTLGIIYRLFLPTTSDFHHVRDDGDTISRFWHVKIYEPHLCLFWENLIGSEKACLQLLLDRTSVVFPVASWLASRMNEMEKRWPEGSVRFSQEEQLRVAFVKAMLPGTNWSPDRNYELVCIPLPFRHPDEVWVKS
jgi:hypothetical protein